MSLLSSGISTSSSSGTERELCEPYESPNRSGKVRQGLKDDACIDLPPPALESVFSFLPR